MNTSALDYINKIRILNAADSMRSTDCSIHEIISKSGFTSESTFNRNFKKYMGLPKTMEGKIRGAGTAIERFRYIS